MISYVLHPDIFEQPVKVLFNELLGRRLIPSDLRALPANIL